MGFSEPCKADHQRDHQTSSDKSTEDLPSIFKAMVRKKSLVLLDVHSKLLKLFRH